MKKSILLLLLVFAPILAGAQLRTPLRPKFHPYTLDVRRGNLYGDNERLSTATILRLLGEDGAREYKSAKSMQRLGDNLMIAGGGTVILAGVLYSVKSIVAGKYDVEIQEMGSTQASSGQKAGAVSLGIAGLGVALAGGGFTLRLLSNRRLERLANDYNYGPRVELDFQCTPGGIGLAMRF